VSEFVPEGNPNAPSSVTLLDIVKTYNSLTGEQFDTRWQNIQHILGAGVSSVTGTVDRITVTPTTGNVIVDIAATYVGQTSIIVLGTVVTGVWQGTTVASTFGGTGLNTYTTGDLLYASAANVLSKRVIGTAGQILTVSGGVPTWVTDTGTGTVTSVSVVTNQGVSGTVATATTTPAITLSLGALTGVTSLNGLVVTANTGVITTGTWNGGVIGAAYGGTGVANNASSTLTISGAFATTLTVSGATSLTLPTSGIVTALGNTTTGSGTTLVLSTTPTFTTSIVTPQITGNGSTTTGLTISTSTTAAAGVVQGILHTPTLTAAANGDALSGLQITPTFTLGAFTSTNSFGITMTCGTATLKMGNVTGTTNQIALYNIGTPTNANYILKNDASNNSTFNAASGLTLATGGTARMALTSTTATFGNALSAYDISLPATNGTKIGTATTQKIGFWNTTPIAQPTTAIAASTFVANTSGIANDTATWDSYTVGQVVKALRNFGILA